jgi:chromosome segregation protein
LIQFNKLRLTGFKSFVEPTELSIEPGLTGIVGPNGCGKSNLVEGLRWVMGETSAKQVRGGEMDDVIFGGTSDRPPRNIAEVLLDLDNTERAAPAAFNDFEELEVSRRIERGSGSTYRVNGKEVRARDVQLLFADSATGARSTALVSQGRVSAIIAAKPVNRRALLEEAAGITGLHSRRHEAELRLRGAETNLERLDDILITLEAQLQSLKKQARQANRYRNISDHIRRAEGALFLVRWRAALDVLEVNRTALAMAEGKVTEHTRRAGARAAQQAEAASGLPDLRQAEAKAAAGLQRLVLARENLDSEEQRAAEAEQECRTRLDQVIADTEREKVLAVDATTAVRRLETEQGEINAARVGEDEQRSEAEEHLAAATKNTEDTEKRLTELTEQVAADEARRADLTRRTAELEERRQRLDARAADVEGQRAQMKDQSVDDAASNAAAAALDAARHELDAARAEADRAEATRTEAETTTTRTLGEAHAAGTALARLEAEEQALADILEAEGSDLWPPVIDAVTVEAGYEPALGAALGEDLSAPTDEPAPVHWRSLAPLGTIPALPDGTEPLSRFVQAPPALDRRLGQIGVVADEAEGQRLADRLAQGQRLVSRDGALWRWDGYTVSAGATTAAAARLEQRNRLGKVRGRIAEAAETLAAAEGVADKARQASKTAAASEATAREAAREADAAYVQSRDTQADLKEQMARHTSRLAGLADTAETIATDLAETVSRGTEAAEALAALPDPTTGRERVTALRAAFVESRSHQTEYQDTLNTVLREVENRRRRAAEITNELATWQQRKDGAQERIEQLEGRQRAITGELENLAARPSEIADQRRELLSTIETADGERKAAADSLAETENRLAEADKDLRAAEVELAAGREERVRAEGAAEQADQACRALRERISERLSCVPDDLRQVAGLADDAEPPELDAVERRVERLVRERDNMGPVNLRAEAEATELSQQLESLESERADLIKAIEKLRQGIAELNREGRERLLASFQQVDQHFRELFVRLFGGGRAHLQLTESDDPLEAGLEIMASPPGKRLQVLSLLSGGEQALTALALLFAVFLTNPAPICVMDEVDAPLDDANVDRFCTLVEEIAHSSRTRFLIITHHRMTMARMDRLFGVTMSERGVSQLVSVDLGQAEELRATA